MTKIIFETFHYLRKLYLNFFNIETFGARTFVTKENKIFLVKHRYGNYFVMPGGKIDKGESPENAAIRELKEETGIIANKTDFLLGTYKNNSGGKNDTVYCFVVTDFVENPYFKRSFLNFLEIKESNWFDINDLPPDISPATKRRIDEFLAGKSGLVSFW